MENSTLEPGPLGKEDKCGQMHITGRVDLCSEIYVQRSFSERDRFQRSFSETPETRDQVGTYRVKLEVRENRQLQPLTILDPFRNPSSYPIPALLDVHPWVEQISL